MPVADARDQELLEQRRFDGGVNMLAQGPDQLADAENVVIRDGKVTTRGGVRRYLAADGGYLIGFWFNEDHEKFNDATHTGFWFPFAFVRSPWGEVQGCAMIRLASWEKAKILFVCAGSVFIYENGFVDTVLVSGVGATEKVELVQTDNQVLMFRTGGAPKVWDGDEDGAGFVDVPAAAVGEDIPSADNGLFHQGRIWVTVADDVYASLILDYTEWDSVKRYWTVQRGAGKPGVILYPFNEDILLAFKDDRVMAFAGVNSVIEAGADLASYVTQQVVNVKTGCVARYAIVTIGEDVWYLGYGGIWSLQRNQQSKVEMDPVAVSVPIQPYIDRINWDNQTAIEGACAAVHDNYILFAVPVDGSPTNNMILVYDRVARNGAGAWVGVWKGNTLNPVRFFNDGGKLLFLSADNAVRVMFTDDPWDSESALADTPPWDEDVTYEPGDLVYYEESGEQIWRALVPNRGQVPGVFEPVEVLDQWHTIAGGAGGVGGLSSMWQSFTAGVTARMTRVMMSAGVSYGPPTMLFRILDGGAGAGAVLFEKEITDPLSITIDPPVTVIAGQQYSLTLDITVPGQELGFAYQMLMFMPGHEPEGYVRYDGGGSSEGDLADITFATYYEGFVPDTHWELAENDGHLYDIESRILTQALGVPVGQGAFRTGRMEVLLQNQNALVDVNLLGRDHGEEVELFADLEWLRTGWDIAGVADWEEDNANLDANDPHRKDYSLVMDETDGLWMDGDGLYAGVWETHAVRFIPMVVQDRWVRVEVINRRGKLRVLGVAWLFASMPMGGRAVA